ncbi:MAG TPA: lactate utilization protein, partial [Actinomycetota bacterium]|nr:lactate utilization protein [Actinomycetota bacterium]
AMVAANNGLATVIPAAELTEAVRDVAVGATATGAGIMTGDVEPWREAIEAGLRDAGVEPVHPDPHGWRDAAAAAGMGVTSAALAIAATGSLLLVPDADSPRVASLLPPVHLAVLPVDRLVPGLEDAMAGVAEAAHASSSAVLVTGPSRTSDIEMTTVYGVHGPRTLRVLLLE